MFSEPDNYIPAPTTLLRTYQIGEYGKNHKKIKVCHHTYCSLYRLRDIYWKTYIMRYCLLFIMVDCDLMVDKINKQCGCNCLYNNVFFYKMLYVPHMSKVLVNWLLCITFSSCFNNIQVLSWTQYMYYPCHMWYILVHWQFDWFLGFELK